MSTGDDDIWGPEHQGLDETSRGSLNPADDVQARPSMPASTTLQLGKTITLDDNLVLEVEHLFGASLIFKGLTKQEIRELVNSATKMPLQAGEVLFKQGDEARAVYIVQSGEIQVRATSPLGEEIVLAVLGSSTVVGELALIDGVPRSATVEALSDCDVYRLTRQDFDVLRAQQSRVAYKVIMNIARTVDNRRRQTEARINEVFEDPEQHIDLFESQVHDLLARLKKV